MKIATIALAVWSWIKGWYVLAVICTLSAIVDVTLIIINMIRYFKKQEPLLIEKIILDKIKGKSDYQKEFDIENPNEGDPRLR